MRETAVNAATAGCETRLAPAEIHGHKESGCFGMLDVFPRVRPRGLGLEPVKEACDRGGARGNVVTLDHRVATYSGLSAGMHMLGQLMDAADKEACYWQS